MFYTKLFSVFCLTAVVSSEHTISERNHHSSFNNGTHWNIVPEVTEKHTEIKNKVNISVYYEILCPASVRFFTRQLRPAVELLAPHLDIHLIPYGHAKTLRVGGNYEFKCQHGPAECYGNKLQACVMDVLRNNTQAVLFNSCLIKYTAYRSNSGYDFSHIMRWCSYKLHVPVLGIRDCMLNGQASLLLKNYGVETQALSPQYVPFVLVDGSTDKQDDATSNLISTICQMLQPKPPACLKYGLVFWLNN